MSEIAAPLSLSEWRSSGRYFSYQNHRLFYRSTLAEGATATDKPILLLIHGFPTSSWDWSKIWSSLSIHFDLVAMDMLGFGLSDKPQQRYSIMEQASMLEALVHKLGISSFHVLAHDYGDTVAQELLARDMGKQHISSMIFSNGGLFPETHHPVLIQKLLLSPIGGWISRLTSYSKFKDNFDRICAKNLSDEELQGYWSLLLENGGRAIMHRLIHYMNERVEHRERWVGAMQETNTPFCLIDGVLDPISGEHMVQRFEQLLAGKPVYRMADTGHYPQVESPGAFSQYCIEFWRLHSVIS